MSRFRKNFSNDKVDETVSTETEVPVSTTPKSKRVEIINKYGATARPFESDLKKWLDDTSQGWKLAEKTAFTEAKEN